MKIREKISAIATAILMTASLEAAAGSSTPQPIPLNEITRQATRLNDAGLRALLANHRIVLTDLRDGSRITADFDDDPNEDVGNRYDDTGQDITWSVVDGSVIEQLPDDKVRRYQIYRLKQVFYACGYAADGVCTHTLIKIGDRK